MLPPIELAKSTAERCQEIGEFRSVAYSADYVFLRLTDSKTAR